MDELLPAELLIEIYAYLKFKDLRHLTLTCKSFNEIISNNSTLMDKFCPSYKNKSKDLSIDVMMKRKYQNIIIQVVDGRLMKFLECYGDDICDLKIQCEEIDIQDFKRILTLCWNMKHMSIHIYELTYSDEDLLEPAMKLTLESLTIHSCNRNFFKILQIEAKKMRVYSIYFDLLSKNALANMLKNQKQLKTLQLEMKPAYFELFNDDSMSAVDFQLETLITEHSLVTNINRENFKKLLNNQKSLVRIIDNGNYHSFDDFNYANFLWNIKHIKELKVPGPYNFLQPFPYIEKLEIEIYSPYERTTLNIRNLFANVNSFSIASLHKIKFVEKFSETAEEECVEIMISENVKTLTIKTFTVGNENLFDDNVEIKIENLTIFRCDNINWLIDCFKNDRIKLKSLTIEATKLKKSQQEYLESLTRGENKKIEKLKICMPMKFDENRDYVYCYDMEDDDNDDDDAKRIKLN